MDEPGAGWRGAGIGESGPVLLYPSRTGLHSLPPPPRARNLGAPRASATLGSPRLAEHKACAVRQSHRGCAPPAGRTAQGRSRSGWRQGPWVGEMRDVWPLTVRAALLPGDSRGHRADTHPGRDAPRGEPKGCIGSNSRRLLAFLSPAVAVADSWEKEKGRKKKKILGSSRWKVSAKPPPNAAVPPKSSPSPDKAAAAAARASCTNSQRMLGRWLPGWVLVGVSCPSHPE